jgi:hypothetical protein
VPLRTPRTSKAVERYKREERERNNHLWGIAAGMLDPQTRADEVRVIRAKSGLPVGMPVRPELERRRPTGSPRPADDDAA